MYVSNLDSTLKILLILLLQKIWNDEFRPHVGKMSKGDCGVVAAVFTEHGHRHNWLHALDKSSDLCIRKFVLLWNFQQPILLLVSLPEQHKMAILLSSTNSFPSGYDHCSSHKIFIKLTQVCTRPAYSNSFWRQYCPQ